MCDLRLIRNIIHVAGHPQFLAGAPAPGSSLLPTSGVFVAAHATREAEISQALRLTEFQHVSTKILCGMRREDYPSPLAFVDQPEILRALCAPVCKGADNPGGGCQCRIIPGWPGGRTRGATRGTAPGNRAQSGIVLALGAAETAGQYRWNHDSNRRLERERRQHTTVRGYRVHVWGANKERHAVHASSARPGALLAAQRNAGDAVAGEVDHEIRRTEPEARSQNSVAFAPRAAGARISIRIGGRNHAGSRDGSRS
jgi:hypothetical protein